jgi:hypothetical protein
MSSCDRDVLISKMIWLYGASAITRYKAYSGRQDRTSTFKDVVNSSLRTNGPLESQISTERLFATLIEGKTLSS